MFRTPTPEEQKARVSKQKEQDKLKKEVEDLIKKCLSNPDFIKYKESYQKLEREVTTAMIGFVENDQKVYAYSMFKMSDTLKRLRYLLDMVETDGRRVK